VQLLTGETSALFEHRKGPTEILLVTSFARILGSYSEGAIRLPYAMAGSSAVGGLYVLARRWFGTASIASEAERIVKRSTTIFV
jgi:hypothetical protein